MTNADRIAALLEAHSPTLSVKYEGGRWHATCGCGWSGDEPANHHVASVLAQAGVLETAGLSDADVDDAAQEFGHRTACDVWWDSTESFKSALRRLASGEPA